MKQAANQWKMTKAQDDVSDTIAETPGSCSRYDRRDPGWRGGFDRQDTEWRGGYNHQAWI